MGAGQQDGRRGNGCGARVPEFRSGEGHVQYWLGEGNGGGG